MSDPRAAGRRPERVATPDSIADRIAGFVDRYRTPLLVAAGVALALMAFWFVWTERERNVSESSALRAETVQDLYDAWLAAPDDTTQGTLSDQLLAEVDDVMARFPRRYAAQRALYVRGQFWAEQERWDDAIADWAALADRWPRSYLATLGTFNAAVAAEEAGDTDAALAHLQRVIEDWGDSVIVPRALFSIGRIHETAADYEQARSVYEQLEADHGGSRWAVAGRNRLIALEAEGILTADSAAE